MENKTINNLNFIETTLSVLKKRRKYIFTILTLIMVIGIIYFYRREQSKRITEGMDKAQVDNLDVFYSYFVTFGFVALVVFSVIFVNN